MRTTGASPPLAWSMAAFCRRLRFSASRTKTNRHGCRLYPEGACAPKRRMASRYFPGTGSGLKLAVARRSSKTWVIGLSGCPLVCCVGKSAGRSWNLSAFIDSSLERKTDLQRDLPVGDLVLVDVTSRL